MAGLDGFLGREDQEEEGGSRAAGGGAGGAGGAGLDIYIHFMLYDTTITVNYDF